MVHGVQPCVRTITPNHVGVTERDRIFPEFLDPREEAARAALPARHAGESLTALSCTDKRPFGSLLPGLGLAGISPDKPASAERLQHDAVDRLVGAYQQVLDAPLSA